MKMGKPQEKAARIRSCLICQACTVAFLPVIARLTASAEAISWGCGAWRLPRSAFASLAMTYGSAGRRATDRPLPAGGKGLRAAAEPTE